MRTRTAKTLVGLVVLTFIATFGAPHTTHAGFFTFMKNLFVHEERLELPRYNSQTISLLEAPLAADLSAARGGGDIAIVDDTALLSASGPAGTIADIEDVPPSDQISLYVVREGDTLSQIARLFGVSTNTLVWANNIRSGKHITPGQTLVILPITGVRHTVGKNDTLASIAKKYGGDVGEILAYNELPDDAVLAVGDELTIPNGELSGPAYRIPARVRGANAPAYIGYYIHPVPGGIKTQGLHGYNSIDIGAPLGTPIIASAGGQVIISRTGGWNGGYGNYVAIRHDNGTQTLYAHNSRNVVSVGQRVVQGQVVAYIGSSGNSTGPHVHFEIRGAKNPF